MLAANPALGRLWRNIDTKEIRKITVYPESAIIPRLDVTEIYFLSRIHAVTTNEQSKIAERANRTIAISPFSRIRTQAYQVQQSRYRTMRILNMRTNIYPFDTKCYRLVQIICDELDTMAL